MNVGWYVVNSYLRTYGLFQDNVMHLVTVWPQIWSIHLENDANFLSPKNSTSTFNFLPPKNSTSTFNLIYKAGYFGQTLIHEQAGLNLDF